ncbi:hypothetical protein NBRC116583_15280 [Arenicella sp. 4NH20-0111]|uniref:hypothetical protein n=1 Tax=Arenicella sp. 4NH20-0111 TaxID=3127648 RepID=UPI0031031D0F
MSVRNSNDIESPATLTAEAKHLHESLFARRAPTNVIQLYLEAHSKIHALTSSDTRRQLEQNTINTIVFKKLNATAIEPWLRRAGSRHLLSSKLLLINYICETGGNHDEYKRDSTLGWSSLILIGIKASLQLPFGLYLKHRHDLI